LVNARLSKRSESRYHLIRPLAAPIFNQLDLLCVQESGDARRWENLGVDAGKILCTGSIKFDDRMDDRRVHQDFREILAKYSVAGSAPIILAGSTHAGEESLLGEVVLRLKRSFPELFYVVVPRHAERWREVREELEKLGLRVALRTNDNNTRMNPDALLVNTTGELRDWYHRATVVFIGGQNPAEAVAAAKPVVFGPNMENFSSLAAQLVRERGALQVADAAKLEEVLRGLLSDPKKRGELAANGARCLLAHHGATARTCQALEDLEPSSSQRKVYKGVIVEPR
jgi:3-deoxy-D-manno-octulosonic-acid transferase